MSSSSRGDCFEGGQDSEVRLDDSKERWRGPL